MQWCIYKYTHLCFWLYYLKQYSTEFQRNLISICQNSQSIFKFNLQKFYCWNMVLSYSILSSNDYGLFGQCQTASMDLCLMFIIRNYYTYPGPQGRSLNGGKPWKYDGFTEIRDFSYTDISKQYRYGYIKERFIGLFTEHRLRTVTKQRLHTVFNGFF